MTVSDEGVSAVACTMPGAPPGRTSLRCRTGVRCTSLPEDNRGVGSFGEHLITCEGWLLRRSWQTLNLTVTPTNPDPNTRLGEAVHGRRGTILDQP